MRTTLFLGGHVFDGRRRRPDCGVAVRGGRIVGVGDLTELRRGADVDVVDLGGGLLLPGFQDAHMHPLVGGLERMRCELTGLSSVEDYLDAIREHAARQRGKSWFRGGGWAVPVFGPDGPTKELLDQVVPDRPAFVVSSDHHNAWVNSKALEVAGVTAATPDPPGGWIERDERGEPTGTLHESAALLVQDHVETSREEYADAMREAQAYLLSWGITGWHDALVGGYASLDDPTQAYLDLLESGELRVNVTCSQFWDPQRGTEQLEELSAQRRRLEDAGLDAGSIKVMMDGITETFTAAMTEPYLGETRCPCGHHGLEFLSAEQAQEAVVALDAAGFRAHFHAIGDRAVHDALDAVTAARRTNGMTDNRHQIAHLQLVRPEDRYRFRELGITANAEGMWAARDTGAVEVLLPHLGDERAGWHYPFRDLVDAGAELAGGSDWPVNPPEPMGGVHTLVNRTSYSPNGDAPEPLVPDQALTLEEALHAYTEGSARVSYRNDVGSILVGSRADLVLLDRDPFLGPSHEIGAAEVAQTWLAGELAYERT